MERGIFLLASGIYIAVLLRLALEDVRTGYLPDRWVLPLGAAGVLLSAAGVSVPPAEALAGLSFGGGAFWIVRRLSRGGMGGGDVKLAAAIGAWTGWPGVLPALFLAFLLGSLVALVLLGRGRSRRATLPFGPFLAAGGSVGMLYGAQIVRWYLEAFL